jgi:hypothetical protein
MVCVFAGAFGAGHRFAVKHRFKVVQVLTHHVLEILTLFEYASRSLALGIDL